MENNRNAKAGKKFLEGILVSIEIMVLFILLQILVSFVGAEAVLVSNLIRTGNDIQHAQSAVMDMMYDASYMTTLTVLGTLVSTLFSVPAYWIIWGRKKSEQDKRYFREKVLKIKPFAMIIIASCGLYYLAILISAGIAFVSPGVMEEYNEMMDMALGGSQMFAMFAAVILAPVNEECIMRGLILKNLQRFFSTPVVVLIQAVLFGVFHLNWVQGLYVLPVGAALGYVAIKSRSILPSIFMHLFYNTLSFALVLLPAFCQTGIFAVSAVLVSAVAVWYMGRTETTPQIS